MPANGSRFYHGYNIVALAFFIMVLTYGVRTSFGVFFKPIEAEFGWSRALISGAVTVSMIVQGLWGIYMGRVHDNFGSRLVITICCFFLGLGLVLFSFTSHSWQLYVFYGLLTGLGMGGIFVSLMATVTRWFVKKRGMMSGIVLAGIGVGTITFAPVSNWLISLVDWRIANLIIGAVGMVAGIAAAQFLRSDPAQMDLLPYGHTGGKSADSSNKGKGLNLKGAAATWQFWVTLIIYICVGYCTFTITIHLVPLITDFGISSAAAAIALAISGGVQSLAGIGLGLTADRIGNRNVILIGMVLMSAALFWLVPISTILMFYLFAVVHGIGIGGSTSMEAPLVAELFGLKYQGILLGAISFGFTLGGSIGPVVTGYLFDTTGSYDLAVIVCAVVGVAGALLTASLRPLRKPI
jgi:MFS family permease